MQVRVLPGLPRRRSRALTYAELTRQDPNPVKRWLQRRRLRDALRLIPRDSHPRLIVDYGGGDGAFAAMASRRFPDARVVCFEPAAELRAQAERLLQRSPGVELVAEEGALPRGADWVVCLEVFEHLPEMETRAALAVIRRALARGGRLVAGVPVEVGPPALAKGLFRMTRRHGEFDARLGAVAGAAFGRPTKARPSVEIAPGRAYFPHHLGFDHRRLLAEIAAGFTVEAVVGSPFRSGPAWLNAELYIVAARP